MSEGETHPLEEVDLSAVSAEPDVVIDDDDEETEWLQLDQNSCNQKQEQIEK